eukprot:scaffold157362_cov28-Tisochrysis_lutea.AAC.2
MEGRPAAMDRRVQVALASRCPLVVAQSAARATLDGAGARNVVPSGRVAIPVESRQWVMPRAPWKKVGDRYSSIAAPTVAYLEQMLQAMRAQYSVASLVPREGVVLVTPNSRSYRFQRLPPSRPPAVLVEAKAAPQVGLSLMHAEEEVWRCSHPP